MPPEPTIHASAVLLGARAVLIRGPAGSGKSRLALALIQAAGSPLIPFARLVSDDRTHVAAVHGRVLARPPAPLAGLIEVRGLGIRVMPYEPVAVVGLVVDLGAGGERLPQAGEQAEVVAGIALPRLCIAPDVDAMPRILAHIHSRAGGA
jgi:hypothetical protein